MKKLFILITVIFLLGCRKEEKIIIPQEEYALESRSLDCRPPLNLITTSVSPTTISLKWNSELTAGKYRVEWTSLNSGVWIYRDTQDTTYTIPGLYSGHTYRIRVKSLCTGWVNDVYYGVSSAPTPELRITTINNTGVCVDMWEYNNTRLTSKPVTLSITIDGKITKPQVYTDSKNKTTISYDDDWFYFFTDGKFRVTLENLPNNYDIELYRTVNGSSKNIILLGSSKNTGITSETIIVNQFIRYERYFVRVYGNGNYNDAICYTLKLENFN